MIEVRVDGMLEGRGRSFYWLAKEAGVSHTTLWRLKKGRARVINYNTLGGICRALNCRPSDVLRLADAKKRAKTGGPKVAK